MQELPSSLGAPTFFKPYGQEIDDSEVEAEAEILEPHGTALF